jgi:hypothetical protein
MTDFTIEPNVKKASLQYDEFAPSEHKENFFSLPHSIAGIKTLSTGAKLLYATLFTLAKKHNTAFATQETLSEYLGSPSISTIRRWQKELENEGLIRVLQKGRGLSNNYYFLRHPTLGNAKAGEFEPGPRPLYRDRQHGTQTIVTEAEGLFIFEDNLREWLKVNTNGGFMKLPKPGIKIKVSKRKELEQKYQQMYVDHILGGYAKSEVLENTKTTTVPSIEEMFAKASKNSVDSIAMTLSDEPVETTLPTGEIIKGPSSRACYEAEMKRRRENEERKIQIEIQRTKTNV